MIKTIYYIIKCSRDVDCVQYTIYRIHEIYRIDMNISGSHAMHLQMAAATPWYNVPLVHTWWYHWGVSRYLDNS